MDARAPVHRDAIPVRFAEASALRGSLKQCPPWRCGLRPFELMARQRGAEERARIEVLAQPIHRDILGTRIFEARIKKRNELFERLKRARSPGITPLGHPSGAGQKGSVQQCPRLHESRRFDNLPLAIHRIEELLRLDAHTPIEPPRIIAQVDLEAPPHAIGIGGERGELGKKLGCISLWCGTEAHFVRPPLTSPKPCAEKLHMQLIRVNSGKQRTKTLRNGRRHIDADEIATKALEQHASQALGEIPAIEVGRLPRQSILEQGLKQSILCLTLEPERQALIELASRGRASSSLRLRRHGAHCRRDRSRGRGEDQNEKPAQPWALRLPSTARASPAHSVKRSVRPESHGPSSPGR